MTVTAPGGLLGLFTITNISSQAIELEGRFIPPSSSVVADYLGPRVATAIAQGLVTVSPSLVRTTPTVSPLSITATASPNANGYIAASGYGGTIDTNLVTLATEVITLGNTVASLEAWMNEVMLAISLSR